LTLARVKIEVMGMYRTVQCAGLASITALTLTLSGCTTVLHESRGGVGSGKEITVGSPAVPEGRLLAEIYGQALAEHSFDISYNWGPGSRAEYLRALQDSAIDLVPDYSLGVLADLAPASRERSAVDIRFALKDALADLGLYSTAPAQAENGRAFVVTKAFATTHDAASIADLGVISSTLTIGATAAYERGDTGRASLEKKYGIAGWQLKELENDDPEVAVAALVAGEVDVVVLTAASKYVLPHDLLVLRDTSLLFRVNNVVPVISSDTDTRSVTRIVDAVSKKLTTQALRELITRQANSRVGDAVIARDWLILNELVNS
jgi:osmoprotectant transport system substrate-binding protein